jgi:hypothetical protein
MIGDIFRSLVFGVIGLLGWRALENYADARVVRQRGCYENKRVANWISLTHSLTAVGLCAGMLVSDMASWILVPVSVSYFAHNIRHYAPGTLIYYHHILSIAAIIHGFQFGSSDLYWYKWGYMLTEIGSIPLHVMYELRIRPDRTYLVKYGDDMLLLEFVFFIVFRILSVSLVMAYTNLWITKINALALQAVNLIWVCELAEQIIAAMGR